MKVSYKAYQYAKKHDLDYKSAAVGGLLHDFFLANNYHFTEKLASALNHPNKARDHALEVFHVSVKEENIIASHMFPISVTMPRYKESWLVSGCDKAVAFQELGNKYVYKLRYCSNLFVLLLLNFIK